LNVLTERATNLAADAAITFVCHPRDRSGEPWFHLRGNRDEVFAVYCVH
jgi:hypothetical protein